jgi:hypothetical protein
MNYLKEKFEEWYKLKNYSVHNNKFDLYDAFEAGRSSLIEEFNKPTPIYPVSVPSELRPTAKMIAQGLCSNPEFTEKLNIESHCKVSIEMAKELIKQLDQEEL